MQTQPMNDHDPEVMALKKQTNFKLLIALYGIKDRRALGLIQRDRGILRELEDGKAVTLNEALIDLVNYFSHNPYDLLIARPDLISFRALDIAVVRSNTNHPWHQDATSPNRIFMTLAQHFQDALDAGSSVILTPIYKNLLIQSQQELVNGLDPNTYSKSQIEAYAKLCHEKLRTTKFITHVDYQDRFNSLSGAMMKTRFDNNHQLAQYLSRLITVDKRDLQYNQKHCVNNVNKNVAFDNDIFLDSLSELDFPLEDSRKKIAKRLITDPVSVLTGYAGTGKTTLLKVVVAYLNDMYGYVNNYGKFTNPAILQVAMSGKAAYNLFKHTQYKASTIAKVLYMAPDLSNVHYLIIDEISMVSEVQLKKLLRLIPNDCHLIMVGDKAQLPAVKDVGVMTSLNEYLLENDTITHFDLTTVHRNGGKLLAQANLIRQGKRITDFSDTPGDDSIKYRTVSNGVDGVAKVYVSVCDHQGIDNTTVLVTNNALVDALNTKIQKLLALKRGLTPNQQLIREVYDNRLRQSVKLRLGIGDKVLITKNMYNRLVAKADVNIETCDIFNGFSGTVVDIVNHPKYGKGVEVKFKNLLVNVDSDKQDVCVDFYQTTGFGVSKYASLDDLKLGYALTVHKSQGSTIPYALLYLPKQPGYNMDTRQILYTAYTRGEHLGVLSDQDMTAEFLDQYISKDIYDHKYSNLKYELEATLAPNEVNVDVDGEKLSDHVK